MVPTRGRIAVVIATVLLLGACSTGTSTSTDSPKADEAGVIPGVGDGNDGASGEEGGGGASTTDTLTVTEIGFSAYEDFDDTVGIVGATVLNNGPKHHHLVAVTFTFRDAAGNEIGSDTHQITTVPSGMTAFSGVQDVPLSGEPAKVDTDIRLVGEDVDWGMPYGMVLDQFTIGPHEWSDGTLIEGTADNVLDQALENLEVSCLLRNGGAIVGAGFSVIDPLEPGDSADWSVLAPVTADEADCLATQQI